VGSKSEIRRIRKFVKDIIATAKTNPATITRLYFLGSVRQKYKVTTDRNTTKLVLEPVRSNAVNIIAPLNIK
jgi:hypothetical protein